MAKILDMLGRNVPLYKHEAFEDSGSKGAGFSYYGKSEDKMARLIFSQLSHDKVVPLLAREFNELPARVRLELRDLCNGGNASGNVRKNVQRLDNLMGGKLLKDKDQNLYQQVRVETIDGAHYKRQVVNPAVAGAHRKYQKVK